MAATMPAEGGWVANGAVDHETAQATLASKPHNTWSTRDLRAAGFGGCVAVANDKVSLDNPPAEHVVRLPAAEGWRWVTMPAEEVASRIEAFGGTATTADDVKLVGNCYGGGSIMTRRERLALWIARHTRWLRT